VLDVNARLGGVLSSIWVFEYGPQNATCSLVPGRDDALLTKLDAANRVLSGVLANETGWLAIFESQIRFSERMSVPGS
jgi:hypothetical protein